MSNGGCLFVMNALSHDACDALIDAAGNAERIIMPHRTHPLFAIGMRTYAHLAYPMLGNEISGLGSDYFSVSAGFATHTDNDYVQALPGSFASVWIALADVTDRNGPLVMDGRAMLCSKGDALVIDGDMPHRSCAGSGPRPVALFTYIKTGYPFRPGKQQQRAAVKL